MRAVDAIDLAAGQPFDLKPGGYHVMLMDLKQPLAKDTSVGLTLLFRNAKGAQARLEVKAPVALQAPGAAPGTAVDAHKH
jgi:copper(I)-binding protein